MLTRLTAESGTVGLIIACALTLLVLSGLLSRRTSHLAQHVLVGVTAGYVGSVIWRQVLIARIILLVRNPGEYWYYGLFVLLGLVLFVRETPGLADLARLPLILLVGVGSGLALGGTLAGTLIPQVVATFKQLSPQTYGPGLSGATFALDALTMVLCTVSALATFRYLALRSSGLSGVLERTAQGLAALGHIIISIVLGALLTGALVTFYTLLVERIGFISTGIPLILHQVGL